MTFEEMKENTIKIQEDIEQMITVLNLADSDCLYKKPSIEEWSVLQIACHVVEAVEFWVADLEALLIVPGAKWGRNHEHVRRLAAVEESVVASISKEQAIEKLKMLIPLVKESLSKVKEEDLSKAAPSYNPNFDGKPLTFLINHLIVLHVESHLGQMKRHLEKVLSQEVN